MLMLLSQIPTTPATGESAIDFTWLFIKMLLVLGIVSISAVLILKYFVPHIGVMKRFQQGKYFKILGRQPIEHKKTLYLIQVGERYLMIGASDHAINLITELKKEDVKEWGN